ncbi:MAG TPA: mannose-6-phosphate isomerase, class I [Pseudolysinimonas sp.]|nr:mannose-6-phosphate isomerase, class I [Pseudolysinimonas sp.]
MFVGITNTPRDYAWGSLTAIPELLGTEVTGRPQAELWLGAHHGSPSQLLDRSGSLADIVDGRLPFLMKVLAAASPLSLQAHPSPAQAEAGFARENAAGIPLDDPARNYRDPFHKPELIYALSDTFRALSGFRPVAETREVLDAAAGPEGSLPPALAAFHSRLADDAALRPTFEWLITRGPGVDELIAEVSAAAANPAAAGGAVHPSWHTVRTLAERYPGDPGIVISLLLHTLELRQGEALFLPAGNIHAYLEGTGIEVMAASDNVLRGGLTRKHVDVPELLSVLDFRPLPAPYFHPDEVQPGVRVFRPDVPDFTLTVVTPGAALLGVDLYLQGGPGIAFAAEGTIRLQGDDSYTVRPGGAVFIRDEARVHVAGNGFLFLASA